MTDPSRRNMPNAPKFTSRTHQTDTGLVNWNTDYHVSRWQAGDNDAARPLVERYSPLLASRLLRLASWSLLSKSMEPMDVVNEAWTRFLGDCKDKFESRGRGSFLALLRDVFDNTAASLARQEGALKRGQGDRGCALSDDGMPHAALRPSQASIETPTSAARVSEIQRIARECLTEVEYQVWSLIHVQSYASDEAALVVSDSGEDMERSASAVRGILKRARNKLVQRL